MSNPHNWSTIYNFWFDCDVAPSQGAVLIDQARVGPGQLSVAVPARVPSGIPSAYVVAVGDGCGDCFASFYETFENTGTTDLVGSSMSLTLTPGGYQVAAGSGSFQPPGGLDLGLGDDAETTVQLPFTLPYPGGSTNQLTICCLSAIQTELQVHSARVVLSTDDKFDCLRRLAFQSRSQG